MTELDRRAFIASLGLGALGLVGCRRGVSLNAAQQVVSGLYDIEDGSWRWTTKQFTVELGKTI